MTNKEITSQSAAEETQQSTGDRCGGGRVALGQDSQKEGEGDPHVMNLWCSLDRPAIHTLTFLIPKDTACNLVGKLFFFF